MLAAASATIGVPMSIHNRPSSARPGHNKWVGPDSMETPEDSEACAARGARPHEGILHFQEASPYRGVSGVLYCGATKEPKPIRGFITYSIRFPEA